MQPQWNDDQKLDNIKSFYDSVYYGKSDHKNLPEKYLYRLAQRLSIQKNQQVLDVACGLGQWIKVCTELGAVAAGVDISEKAIDICKQDSPDIEFHAVPAENLPFDDNRFDLVTCLGSLEHFVDPIKSIKEMIRTAKHDATFILLVPNADFLTRKLGLFAGTKQVEAKEEVRALTEWNQLFESAGLVIEDRWKDLHVLSWYWISLGKWYQIPIRALQAGLLTIWPLSWQYQVYHRCKVNMTVKKP